MKTRILILLSLLCLAVCLQAQSIAKHDSSASIKNAGYTLTIQMNVYDSDAVTGRASLNSLGWVDVCVIGDGTLLKIFKCTNSLGKPSSFSNLAKGKYTVTCTKQNYISTSCVIDIGEPVFACVTDKSEKAKINCGSNISDDKVYNLYITMQPK